LFCGEGTGARVYTSQDPLKAYVYRGNINRYPGEIRPAANDGSKNTRAGVSINATQYAEIQLSNTYSISSVKLTLAHQRFVSHCIADGQSNVLSNGALPQLFVAYQNEQNEWKTAAQLKSELKYLRIGTQTHELNFKPFQASRIKTFTAEIPHQQSLLLSEIEVLAGSQNVGSASKEAPVLEVKNAGQIKEGQELPVVIPAQQTYVAEIPSAKGKQYLWMGDLWGSRPDGMKGHNFQYWSSPLHFDTNGNILPLRWENEGTLNLKK
jgi:hypothetical protein